MLEFTFLCVARQAMIALIFTGSLPAAMEAQPTPPPGDETDAGRDDDEYMNLSLFVVSGTRSGIGRYDSMESISAGRVRMNIMDSSQSISVITTELIEDVAAGRGVDATKFVAGVTDATLPTSWEFTFMRGFLSEGRTVDGITYGSHPSSGYQNLDPAIIDRIEIVKGPNSILAPRPTSPGGTANFATKKPLFRNRGQIGLQFGRFDADSAYVDVNHVAGEHLAFRFVGSTRRYDHWWQGAWVQSDTLMPALTWRISADTQATIQYTFTDWDAQNYFGLPVDPAAGTSTGPARILAGVPRDLNVVPDDATRATTQHELKFLFTSRLWKGIEMRLVAAYNTSSQDLAQINTGASTGGAGGAYDPLTGRWNPGLQYSTLPPYEASPITVQPTRTYTRGGVALIASPRQFNVQNDYAGIIEGEAFKSTTLAGFAYGELRDNNSNAYALPLKSPTFNIDDPKSTEWSKGRVFYLNHRRSRFAQIYVSENLALLKNRLILSGAGSWQHYRDSLESQINPQTASASSDTALPSYGVVIKPWREAVSLYYGYSEQSSSNGVSLVRAIPPLSASRQDEFGARFKGWDNRLYFTVAHYEIFQENFATPNPDNLAIPPPAVLQPDIFTDRTASGWEYELRANPAPGLSIIASYTHYRNRDLNGIVFRGVAEKAGSLLASYTFSSESTPVLGGLRVALAVDYVGNRAGDNRTAGYTGATLPSGPVPFQPSFFLGSRTLANLTLAYNSKHRWSAQLNVDNLFDEEYIQSSVTRFAVFPGPSRNFRASVRYDY